MLLEKSSIVERKAFLKSFVEIIEVGDANVKVVYTLPMPSETPRLRDHRSFTFYTEW